MKSTYSIKDATNDLKQLNDFLGELGESLNNNQADFRKLEELLTDDEFSKLMKNAIFFRVQGFRYLSEIYSSRAEHYAKEAQS